MKNIFIVLSVIVLVFNYSFTQENQEPWSVEQLVKPRVLAEKIIANQAVDILILAIGFDDLIKGSVYVGPGRDKEALDKLELILKSTSKDKEIVLYCGCCPFENCPNIRPAFERVQSLGFQNAKLLDISDNIKINWLDKGYPIKSEE